MYSAEISRRNPTCFLFLVDQSGSMSDSLGGNRSIQKANFVADSLNKTLQNLVVLCAKSEGIRDYFHLGVIGYGGNGAQPALSGNLTGREMVPISEVADNPSRIEDRTQKVSDGAGGIIEVEVKFPIWIDQKASGGTPMVEALSRAHRILQSWTSEHPNAFPPVVLHITDGESTDGNPTEAAEELTSLATTDGNVLLFNLHTSAYRSDAVRYPSSFEEVPANDFAKLLFQLSSDLPPHMLREAQSTGYPVGNTAKGFIFNADIEDVVTFLEIGTRPANMQDR